MIRDSPYETGHPGRWLNTQPFVAIPAHPGFRDLHIQSRKLGTVGGVASREGLSALIPLPGSARGVTAFPYHRDPHHLRGHGEVADGPSCRHWRRPPDPVEYRREQVSRDRDLCHLQNQSSGVAGQPGPDLHQPVAQRRQAPAGHLFRQHQPP